MGKIKVDARPLAIALERAIKELGSPDNMRVYGQMAADMIRLRTRLGSGVEKDGDDKKPLKPLTKTTIEVRKGNLAFFRSPSTGKPIPYKPDANGGKVTLHAHTSPSKSNLTRTGQLLDSIDIQKVSQNKVIVGPTGSRTDGKTNNHIASHQENQGRPFSHLSRIELKRVRDQISKDLRDLMKRLLTKG